MKKTLSLVLALLFVLALFAGCNNGGATTPTAAPDGQATQAPATKAPATQAPATQAPSGNEPAAPAEPEPVDAIRRLRNDMFSERLAWMIAEKPLRE